MDALEKAYLRDSIREAEYTETCDRLLRQYKSNLADETVAAAFGDLDSFKAEWGVGCPPVYASSYIPLTGRLAARSPQGN